MPSNDQPGEVTTYAAAVRAALADLPAHEADVLLEDLEGHLAEIVAEGEGPLTERLGPPEQYAQELRAAYRATRTEGRRQQHRVLRDVRFSVTWVKSSPWYQQVRAFLPSLRPAWWVLRAYLAVLIVTAALSPGYDLGPIPNPGTIHGLAEILATGVAIWLSVRIGRRRQPLPQPARLLALSANVLIAFVAIVILGSMRSFPSSDMLGASSPEQPPFAGAFAAGPTTNIYPYSQDGKPLTNVLLFDQDGRPIGVQQSEAQSSYPTGADGQPITNAYPLTQRHVNGDPVAPPRVAIPPWPSPSPTAMPAASPSPSPTPSATH